MNKTIQSNISGFVFHLDENAYSYLDQYLKSLQEKFKHEEGRDEIIADIESRIAEIFKANMGSSREVVNMDDVKAVIEILGRPEDFESANEESAKNQTREDSYTEPKTKRIFRDPDNRQLGGVAAGIAAYLGIDPVIVRALWIIAVLTGFGVLAYLILWIIIPEAKTTSEKLMMKGQEINIDNIEKSIKKEFDAIKKKLEETGNQIQKTEITKKTRGLGRSIESIFSSLAQIFLMLIKFVFKLIGAIIILALVIVFAALLIALFGTGLSFNGVYLGVSELMAYAHTLFANQFHLYVVYISIVAVFFSILLSLILTSLKMMSIKGLDSRFIRIFLGLITGVSISILFGSGVWMASKFSNQARYTEWHVIEELEKPDTLFISVQNHPKYEDYGWNRNFTWIVDEGEQYLKQVRFSIKRSKDNQISMEIKKIAQGMSKSEAREQAHNIDYQYKIEGNQLQLNDYIRLLENEKFRNQKLEISLYIPEKQAIFLNENTLDILYRNELAINSNKNDLPNNYWLMTEAGLMCLSCGMPQ